MSEMEKEKKPEFVVTDRRKFTIEGDPREGVVNETSSPAPNPGPAPTPTASAEPPKAPEPAPAKPAAPPPQQKAAPPKAATGAGGPDLQTGYNPEKERAAFGGQKMEFMHLLDMLVQTAMMYAGAMETGAERRVDIVGLRQMIDLMGVLEEKTKGNLTEQEDSVLKNTMFQLRMTYMEIVNMIDRQAMKSAPGTPGPTRK
jgi:uncharacterized protein DUF1844